MKNFRSINLIVKIYALVAIIFALYRGMLFVSEWHRVDMSKDSVLDVFKAFFMGLRFDVVILGYILVLPALVMIVADLFRFKDRRLEQFLFWWIFVFFTIAFFICAVDIPFFNQFFERFSMGAFKWVDHAGFVTTMVIEEPRYFFVLIPWLILSIVFYRQLKKLFKNIGAFQKTNIYLKTGLSLLFLLLMLLGIRGRVTIKSPIRIGTAYFSNNAFLNQLGLNPVFTLMRSYLDSKSDRNKRISLMDETEAIRNTRRYLNLDQPYTGSPIARSVSYDTVSSSKPNVVLIIMESMTVAKMKRHGNPANITPYLDSLSNEGLYFENIYTAGIHTFNGVFSSLFSFPALYRQQPLKDIRPYNGLPNVLRAHDYSTIYFTTHDGQFDNVEGFLYANDFQNVIAQDDYPPEEIKTTLGVPDDYMFEFSLPYLDDLNAKGQPFLATFMTASDHGPYYIPDYFQPKSENVKQQIVEYADWSLRSFIDKARQKPWFDNTVFVFIADHGAPLSAVYDISLDYHHTPLLFYGPQVLDTIKTDASIGGQIDVYPTLMGLLKLPYTNNTLGIDLLKEKRPYIYFNGDDKVGVLDEEFLYIMKKELEPKLYKYRTGDRKNYIDDYSAEAAEMDAYARANMQVFQYLLERNLVRGSGSKE